MTIAVIIPCYNVSEHIESVICKVKGDVDFIIAVDDCSTDNTSCILLKLQQENKKLIFLEHDINQGVGGAMLTGFRKALELDCRAFPCVARSRTKRPNAAQP